MIKLLKTLSQCLTAKQLMKIQAAAQIHFLYIEILFPCQLHCLLERTVAIKSIAHKNLKLQ